MNSACALAKCTIHLIHDNQLTRIFHDLFWCFALNLSGNVLKVVSAPLLIGLDELVKVTLVPDGKSLPEETQTRMCFLPICNCCILSHVLIPTCCHGYLCEEVLLLLQLLLSQRLGLINLRLLLLLHLG